MISSASGKNIHRSSSLLRNFVPLSCELVNSTKEFFLSLKATIVLVIILLPLAIIISASISAVSKYSLSSLMLIISSAVISAAAATVKHENNIDIIIPTSKNILIFRIFNSPFYLVSWLISLLVYCSTSFFSTFLIVGTYGDTALHILCKFATRHLLLITHHLLLILSLITCFIISASELRWAQARRLFSPE